MAWNEPGGPGKKDPWGNGGNQGPPDLDEVLKKMQDKLGSVFGGKKRRGTPGGGGSGLGKAGGFGFGLIAAIIIGIWALSGLYIVEEGKRGVVLQFGKYVETTLPGLHWFPRFVESYEIVDIDQIRDVAIGYRSGAGGGNQSGPSVTRESLMLTQDENIVDIKIAVQYKVNNPGDFLFNVKDPEITLRQAAESAVREIIGKNEMDFIISEGRIEIRDNAQALIQQILDTYGAGMLVTSVNLQDAQPPEQVQDAFADAVKAREDFERLKNEAEAYSNDIIPKARGGAARTLEEAQAYKEQVIAEAQGEAARFEQVLAEYRQAPEVTRKRLYIESIESVLSRSSKVMVDVDGGNNLLYLPLDRIVQGRVTGGAASGGATMTDPAAAAGQGTSVSPRPDRFLEDTRESSRSTGER